MKSQLWSLDPSITYLNHGSFGACPRAVLEKQSMLRQRIEHNPHHFFKREFEGLLDAARIEVAKFLGGTPENLVFVPNATTGVNTVLRSLQFQPGDELLTTSQEYNASRNALNFVADRAGVKVVVADIPFPIASTDQMIAAILGQLSPKTKLALLDHVASQTSLIFPMQQLVSLLAERGVDVLVDGAHAPGMIPLNLAEMGAAYYTGNCHKWLCAPKGAAFLYIRPDRHASIRPLTISHGANSPRRDRSRLHLEFDWTGTPDPTAYLCIPVSIQWLAECLPGGWPALMAHNHDLALTARHTLCQTLKIQPPSPAAMVGSMASIPLPHDLPADLPQLLYERFKIEAPIIPWPDAHHRLLRISAQLYNTEADYEKLATALGSLWAKSI
ncbi:MAG: aminotransferase class V-fold PLP-dependent enzyme [Cyanothece sp. SIO1E1]|nr:aminotransferase class V-fold PLP-dependent enzyme [Cyanothece sp. SIO1E1]